MAKARTKSSKHKPEHKPKVVKVLAVVEEPDGDEVEQMLAALKQASLPITHK